MLLLGDFGFFKGTQRKDHNKNHFWGKNESIFAMSEQCLSHNFFQQSQYFSKTDTFPCFLYS